MAKTLLTVMHVSMAGPWALWPTNGNGKKQKEMQFGGVIYSGSADKGHPFIMIAAKEDHLVFLQDVTGFMVGSKSEHGGIIKDGAKMVNAVKATVWFKVYDRCGNSYGAEIMPCGRPRP